MGPRRPDSPAGPPAPRRPAPRQTAGQIAKVLRRRPTDPANGKVKLGSAIYARGRIGRALVAAVSWLVPGLTRAGTPLPWVMTVAMAMTLAGCATPGGVKAPVPEMSAPPAQPPQTPPPQVATGTASWYGKAHNGRPTASGEIYDMNDLTAAHRSLPLGTRVLVTNLKNGRSVEVRVNDRGPVDRGRIIDLSYAAAVELDAVEDGTVPVRLRVLSPPPSQQKPAR